MWRVPGLTKAGLVCEAPTSLINIYPTLVELCNLSTPTSKLDGRSIVPLLKNPLYDWKYPAVTTYKQGNQAIRSKQYCYIRYNDGTEELYDETKDSKEWHNIANDPAMGKVIADFRKQVSPNFVPATASVKTGEG